METEISWWAALALVLVLEGLFPFISPKGWRHMFAQLLALRDGQIRFMGLLCIAVGLALLWVLE
ncbi:DUF2065 domain-containing protein [Comamonas jiangduensis]|jgi:uncharacterized protein YjeT (DUF2065 family)|uniref:DUF2065 domain-containing protein n=1 Tax=Comamonas jiangduensis TaxID=1194168 RepID=A0ABV4IF24_9BURK